MLHYQRNLATGPPPGSSRGAAVEGGDGAVGRPGAEERLGEVEVALETEVEDEDEALGTEAEGEEHLEVVEAHHASNHIEFVYLTAKSIL